MTLAVGQPAVVWLTIDDDENNPTGLIPVVILDAPDNPDGRATVRLRSSKFTPEDADDDGSWRMWHKYVYPSKEVALQTRVDELDKSIFALMTPELLMEWTEVKTLEDIRA